MLELAVFVSGGGTNLQAILDQITDGRLEGVKVGCVIASRTGTYAEQRASQAGIPVHVLTRKNFPSLSSYDLALIATLEPYSIGLVVLAGFLSLIGPDFVAAYANRIINIHPSLIPAFCGHGYYGIIPHQAALAYGVKISGATVHFVDNQYDSGPIILQQAVPVLADDTPQSLQLRIMQDAEQVILPQAIGLLAAGRIEVTGRIARINMSENHETVNHQNARASNTQEEQER